MKFIKGYKLISQRDLSKLEADAEVRGAKESKQRIEELKRSIEKKNSELVNLRHQKEDLDKIMGYKIKRLETKISVLEEERDDIREIEKQSIKNADTVAILNAKEKGLDKREKSLDEREEKLADAETTKKMTAYADGLADGLRKAHEITEKDRENALKVAMVSAASHTSPEIMKELNSVHKITTGDSKE